MFFMDAKTGEVRVNKPIEVNSSQVTTEEFNLNILASLITELEFID
jgi:hypothetical protein